VQTLKCRVQGIFTNLHCHITTTRSRREHSALFSETVFFKGDHYSDFSVPINRVCFLKACKIYQTQNFPFYHFCVYNSVTFSTLMLLCNTVHIWNLFILPNGNPTPTNNNAHSSPLSPWKPPFYIVSELDLL
jgi:hypothetical protein